jgi:hypothetical protein
MGQFNITRLFEQAHSVDAITYVALLLLISGFNRTTQAIKGNTPY